MVSHRLLLITPDGVVVVNHPVHGELGFPSLDEFRTITGEDLGQARAMNYEPDNGFYMDAANPAVNVDSAPVLRYEAIIDNVPLYRQRLADSQGE